MPNDKPDYFALCKIYLGILTEKQCKVVFKTLTKAKESFIRGSMPFGRHFYHCNKIMFGDDVDMKEEIISLDEKDYVLYPMAMVVTARYILKERITQ